MPIDNPSAAEMGGLYGINVETLSGDKTLTPRTDKIYQYFDPDGADRMITLDTASASAGDRFIIRHNGIYSSFYRLQVRQAAVVLDYLHAGVIKEFIFDGTNWVSRGIGTGENDDKRQNLAIGYNAKARGAGTALGYNTQGYLQGVALGHDAKGFNYGVGIGWEADGASRGVAIGFDSDSKENYYSIALGYYSECVRWGETSININGADDDQENNAIQGRWERELAGGAGATELWSAGATNKRFLIRASSHLAFRITVVARDNVANEGAMYTFEGLIKRDASNNTVLSVVTKAVVFEDDGGWDCNVTADDTNESLKIEVTGDGANITQWAAVMNGVETHF